VSRYRTLSYTTALIGAGASSSAGDTNQAGFANFADIVKIKIEQNTVGGTFSAAVYSNDGLANADRLIYWGPVTAVYHPADRSTVTPSEAKQGYRLPYNDEDLTNELHLKITNNDVGAHTYTVTVEYLIAGVLDVREFGAVGDGVVCLAGASMTNGSATLTVSGATILPGDVGKLCVVCGADASSQTLCTSIASYISPTQATLADPAGSTVSGVDAMWATDDTAAINTAFGSGKRIAFPEASYGFTALRLYQGQQIDASGINGVRFLRMAQGVGGGAIEMNTGETAEHMLLRNFGVWCNAIGSALNGIELGTEPSDHDFATGSVIEHVRVYSATGTHFKFKSNTGQFRNLWAQNPPSNFPLTLSAPSSRGFVITGSTAHISNLIVEGRFENGEIEFGAGSSWIDTVHVETKGNYGTKDIITVNANAQRIRNVLVCATSASTRRDVVRIPAGTEYINVEQLVSNPSCGGGAITYTYILNDLNHTPNRTYNGDFVFSYFSYDTAETHVQDIWTQMRFNYAINLPPQIELAGAIPALQFTDSGSTRFFSIRNESDALIIKDVVNATDLAKFEPGPLTTFNGLVKLTGFAFASLGTPNNGTITWCTDCKLTSGSDNTCAGTGTGAFAFRSGGIWRCFETQN
jgi:hypothetical protein